MISRFKNFKNCVVDDACENGGGGALNQDHQGLLSINIILCPIIKEEAGLNVDDHYLDEEHIGNIT